MDNEQLRCFLNSLDLSKLQLKRCQQIDQNSNVWNLQEHSHDCIELMLLLSGTITVSSDIRSLHTNICDIIIYPPNVIHKERLDMTKHQEIIFIWVDVPYQYTLNVPFTLQDTDGSLLWLFKSIIKENSKKDTLSNKIVKTYATAILQHIIRFFETNQGMSYNYSKMILEYVHDNYSQNISLSNIAEMFHVSSSYITKLFQKEVGLNPIEYITNLKIEEAKRLLSQNISIEEISNRVGFSDAHYFGRIFKKYVGFSPSKYRKSLIDQ